MRKWIFPVLFLFTKSIKAQPAKIKDKIYFYWGYNRGWYSKSDIHIHGPEYDLNLYQVRAKDRPEPFRPSVYLNPGLLSIPQFNIRVGYQLTENWALSLGYDHMKYVMRNDQSAPVSGYVGANISPRYAGTYFYSNTYLSRDFLAFEHTDGLNNIGFNIDYTWLNVNRVCLKTIQCMHSLYLA